MAKKRRKKESRRKKETQEKKETEGLEQLPLDVVEKCLVEVWVEAREKAGVECQEIARRLKKYPSFVTRTEKQGRHVPAMEMVWMSTAYGLEFSEASEAWLGKLKREYDEMRKARRTA